MKFPSPEIDPSPRPSCGTHLLGFGRPNSHYGPSEDAQTLRTTKPVTTFMIAAALGATCLSIFAYGRPQQQLCSRTYDAHVQCFHWTRRQWFQRTGVASISSCSHLLSELRVRLEMAIFVCVILARPSLSLCRVELWPVADGVMPLCNWLLCVGP